MSVEFNAQALLDEYGDVALVRDLAQLLVDTLPAQLESVQSAIASKDSAQLKTAAHKLKGSLASFDVPQAVEWTRALEAEGAAGELVNAPRLGKDLAEVVQELRAGAAHWLATSTGNTV